MEAIAVALAGIGSAAAVLVLALKGWSAERRAGENKARADALDVNLTNLAAMLADSTNREKEQRERADRANKTIKNLLAEMAAAPAAGSYQRLLGLIKAAEADDRDGDSAVHLPAGADGGSDRGLFDTRD